MSKLFAVLMISMFSFASFPVHAAKAADATQRAKEEPSQRTDAAIKGDSVNHSPVRASGSAGAESTELAPAKATDTGYTPPPDLNDRSPISN